MKKISGLFVFLALSVSLFACSAQEQPGKELPEPVRPSVPDKDDEDQYLKDEGALRLVTYNVGSFSKSDKTSCGLVSAMMLELKADVISFNELDRNTDRSGRVDQLAEVAAGMDGWKYVFAKAISLGGGEYGNGIAYNPVTVGEPVSQFTIAFPEAAEPRVCLVLEFEDFVFASTHLDVASPTERVAEVTEITRQMMDIVIPAAEEQGYRLDNCVTSDGLPAGRPYPYMIYKNMCDLAVPSRLSVLKYGDTISDIREGVNAGVWTVGVILGSNELGLTEEEVKALSAEELKRRMMEVRYRMYAAGAHYVVDSIEELPALIKAINERMNKE